MALVVLLCVCTVKALHSVLVHILLCGLFSEAHLRTCVILWFQHSLWNAVLVHPVLCHCMHAHVQVMDVINEEERQFLKTLSRGRKVFKRTAAKLEGTTIPGEYTC